MRSDFISPLMNGSGKDIRSVSCINSDNLWAKCRKPNERAAESGAFQAMPPVSRNISLLDAAFASKGALEGTQSSGMNVG